VATGHPARGLVFWGPNPSIVVRPQAVGDSRGKAPHTQESPWSFPSRAEAFGMSYSHLQARRGDQEVFRMAAGMRFLHYREGVCRKRIRILAPFVPCNSLSVRLQETILPQ
jgi:hypothetical protein